MSYWLNECWKFSRYMKKNQNQEYFENYQCQGLSDFCWATVVVNFMLITFYRFRYFTVDSDWYVFVEWGICFQEVIDGFTEMGGREGNQSFGM